MFTDCQQALCALQPGPGLRLVVHDFTGHPFQVQLSRALARRGHQVLHLYAAGFETPHGSLERHPEDPSALRIEGLGEGLRFSKYGLMRRWRWERIYGGLLASRIADYQPHVVVSANTPLGSQAIALRMSRTHGAAFVFWVQDLLSIGIDRAVRRRLPLVGWLAGRHYVRLEARLLRQSDAVVSISQDFLGPLFNFGVRADRTALIENWAPLDELPVVGKCNSWALEHGFSDKFCFVYAGTLGLKHNPNLLADLAQDYRDRSDVAVIVVSEGLGADWLREQKVARVLNNLHVFPFQDYSALPLVFGTADVLISVLEPDAGQFSVPSKVLSYLCAARPILGAMPPENLAARTIIRSGGGVVVEPRDRRAFLQAAMTLSSDGRLRARMGAAGRAYAEEHFAIGPIATQFEGVLARAMPAVATGYAVDSKATN